jgi:2-polyprenyl-3-methyl-5-hydroxy-6-metoxy-1,4-benzoquinol methylase
MKWSWLRFASWIDTRADFVNQLPWRGRLLDLGSSDGGTLTHFAELRPDIALASADIEGAPAKYPTGTDFKRADFDTDSLPWPDGSFDGITCMHVVEHLQDPAHIIHEAFRLLRPGGSLYLETPAPETVSMKSATGEARGKVTVNFFDDPTHVAPVGVPEMMRIATEAGFRIVQSGRSRNLAFCAAYPLLATLAPHSRKRYVAQLHWIGWSAFVIVSRDLRTS